ncbi:MAG: hypothetical protein JXP48_06670 [Acidobacteria bacterium]|nr:hypothetical protein [Acidobacteriota bacterium]
MRIRKATLPAAFLALSISSWAAMPRFWENFTREELLQGSFSRVSLDPDGALSLAPPLDLWFDTGQEYIFSMVRDRAGNLYVGTGTEGKVYRIDPEGKGSLYFDSGELHVFALALDSSDTLYAATSPDGKVYRLRAANDPQEFCDPEEKYLWAMAFDPEDNLYLGTGAGGSIYRVNRAGEAALFYASGDSHVRCLMIEGKDLLAGTSPDGRVLRVDGRGRGFALADTPYEEVHALALDRFGTLYAVASSPKAPGAPPGTAPAGEGSAKVSTTVTVVATVSAGGSTAGGAGPAADTPPAETPKGKESAATAVYAIAPDGAVELLYSTAGEMAFDAAPGAGGALLLATGPKGRLLKIRSGGRPAVVTDLPEEDAVRLLAAGDDLYIGASNRGKVYRLRKGRAASGVFESDPLDAGIVSSWGRISWNASDGGRGVTLATRSGNTPRPDPSWSDWTSYPEPGRQIQSPRARYLQWRAGFEGDGEEASLEGVRISYQQQNVRPRVTELKVLPHGLALEKQPSLASSGIYSVDVDDGRSLHAPRRRGREDQPLPPRQALEAGVRSFTWKAEDDNGDPLLYSLYFKGEAESEWKLLGSDLVDTFYTLGTASLPDGTYRLKVVASDEPGNPFDRFLIGERVSAPFVVAGGPPSIEILARSVEGRRVEVRFRAGVSAGAVHSAEYSIDGGAWRLLSPVDGIADSPLEEYLMVTPELAAGEHLIGIRAGDRNGTTGTAGFVLTVP